MPHAIPPSPRDDDDLRLAAASPRPEPCPAPRRAVSRAAGRGPRPAAAHDDWLAALLPTYLVLDEALRALRAGPALRRVCPNFAVGVPVQHLLYFESPMLRPAEVTAPALLAAVRAPLVLLSLTTQVRLRGQTIPVGDEVLLAVAPWFRHRDEVEHAGLGPDDFPPHDAALLYLAQLEAQAEALARRAVPPIIATDEPPCAAVITAAPPAAGPPPGDDDPPLAAQPPGRAPLDPAVLERLRRFQKKDAPDIVHELLRKFLAELADARAGMEAAARAEPPDLAALAAGAHKVKASSGYLGATPLQALCAELEHHARAAAPADVMAAFTRFGAECDQLEAQAARLLAPGPA